MKNFALIGTAGYVAPRHLKAIKETGNNLIASLDKSDSVGIIDSYFTGSEFFTDFKSFDDFIQSQKTSKSFDYLSVCTPNHIHHENIIYGLKQGANVICEKPLVINPEELKKIKATEDQTGKRVYTILQLRLLDQIKTLKKEIEKASNNDHEVEMTYITRRGNWYHSSWKGDESKSGGIITNIGIHLFDLILWLFGDCKHKEMHVYENTKAAGYLELEKAKVKWFLSIDENDLPHNGKTSHRSIKINDKELEFSLGFEDLHTKSYQAILDGNGFGIETAFKSIDLVYALRNNPTNPNSKNVHHKLN